MTDQSKRAKVENDDRFMLERDEARAEVARLRAVVNAVETLADSGEKLHRKVWDELDDYADIGYPKGEYVEGGALVLVRELRAALAAAAEGLPDGGAA